jgi:hypothetical protein
MKYAAGIPERVCKKLPAFVEALEKCGNVTLAARASGLTRRQVYSAINTDQALKDRVEEARELFVDRLEEKASSLALEGDPRLLIELLRANRPEKYGWRGVRVEGGAPRTGEAPSGSAERGLALIDAWMRGVQEESRSQS